MTGSRRSSAIWLIAVSDIVAIGAAQVFDPGPLIVVLVIMTIVGSFSLVGALLTTRLPKNPISWILFIGGTVIGWAIVGVTYATYSGTTCGECLPGTVAVAVLASLAIIPVIGAVGIFVPLLFPDGHLLSPRWRPVAWFALASICLLTVVLGVTPGQMSSGAEVPNPIGIDGFAGTSSPIGIIAIGATLASLLLALASVVLRYRQGDVVHRQQLRWFGYAALLMVVFIPLGTSDIGPMADSGWIVTLAGLALLPLATGVAILRYRLYDIDRIISRTIGWALVSGVLVVTSAGVVIALQAALSGFTQGETLAVAASTLVAFALFQPIRRRVQRTVDSRFDRTRYDAERVVAAFSEQLRHELDLETLAGEVDRVASETVRPTTATVWMRPSSRGSARQPMP